MDYEQDARDKQTYALFGGRKPQLLGDDRDALIASQARRIEELEKAATDALASLVAAVSLLERGGKRAAPSDKMFAMMLADYKASIDRARSPLNRTGEE